MNKIKSISIYQYLLWHKGRIEIKGCPRVEKRGHSPHGHQNLFPGDLVFYDYYWFKSANLPPICQYLLWQKGSVEIKGCPRVEKRGHSPYGHQNLFLGDLVFYNFYWFKSANIPSIYQYSLWQKGSVKIKGCPRVEKRRHSPPPPMDIKIYSRKIWCFIIITNLKVLIFHPFTNIYLTER